MRRWIVAFAAVIAVAALTSTSALAQTPPTTKHSFPEYWRGNFMNACTQGGADPAICSCALRGFEFSWPFWVAEAYDAASALPAEQRTAEQLELMGAAERIVIACVGNTNAY